MTGKGSGDAWLCPEPFVRSGVAVTRPSKREHKREHPPALGQFCKRKRMRDLSLAAALSPRCVALSKAALGGMLLGVALFALASPATAQGTPEQRAACEQDAYRLCNAFIPDEQRTASCLRRNRLRLSPACRAVFSGKVVRQPRVRTNRR
jgi:hypothetical protein